MAEEAREVTMEERLEMVGEEVTGEDREFYEGWRSFNRRIGFKQAVSVADHREIDLIKTFWKAGLAHGRRDALAESHEELVATLKSIEWRLVQMREYVACERCQHTTPTDREHLLAARGIVARALVPETEV